MSKVKPTRLSGKNLILSAIKALEEETGFHIIDVEFGDTYFLFEGKKDSICHFHIKEIPKFKFAFWNTNRFDTIQYEIENDLQLWSDYYMISSKSELVFFTQFERDIDKFKPSYSGFVQGIYRNAWKETSEETNKSVKVEEWYLSDIPDILKFMHKHPMKAFVYSGCREAIWDEISNFSILKTYINSAIYYHTRKIREFLKIKKYIRVVKRAVRKLKTMDYLVIERESCYPEIELRVTTKPDINVEDYNKDVNILEKLDNKYFNKISMEYWYAVNENNEISPLSKKEKNEDRQLKKRFYNYYNTINDIMKGNSKETLSDWWVKRVITTNIKEEN